jgi:hypothetical protein
MLTLSKIVLWSWLATSQVDAGLTAVALHRGAVERNPLIGSGPAWALPMVKTSSAGLSVWYSQKFRADHPKLVVVVGMGATAFYSAVDVHNAHVIAQQRR